MFLPLEVDSMKSGGGGGNAEDAAKIEGQASVQANNDAIYANKGDTYSAFGSNTNQREMVIDPATGMEQVKWTNRETLSPEMQTLFNQDMNMNMGLGATAGAMDSRINDSYSQAFNLDKYGGPIAGPQSAGPVGGNVDPTTANTGNRIGRETGNGAFSWDSNNRGRAEDAAYARSKARLDPQWQQDSAAFDRKMANRGIRAGDSAFDSSQQNFNNGKNDAYEMARLGSVDQGRIEDMQSYGQGKGTYETNKAAEAQRFNESERINNDARATENQAFTQGIASGENARAADQQSYTQESNTNATANALRTQGIQEDLALRNMPLEEQQRILASRNVSDMGGTYSSGG